ncbi:MAG: energy-coupled thiamine transporter ThiT [Erysipelotrichales bacterium]|nr:energy-coupled thiamine transporter ThiT [Erysipelotrichales bacterium]
MNKKTKMMVYMAMFVAIQLVLEPLTKITDMPYGGNVAFSLIALFLASYLLGPLYGCIASMVCLGAQFVLGLATYYGVVSLFLDYVIPMMLVGLCGVIPLWRYKGWVIPLGMIPIMIIKTISHLLAGWYAFEIPLRGNLLYNLPYNAGTLVACFILFIIIYPRLEKILKID